MKFERKKIDTSMLPPVLTKKWTERVLDEGFVPFPKRLLRCCWALFKGPTRSRQLITVMAIVDYQRPGMTKKPSLEYLAFVAGMPPAKFQETLNELKAAGLIKVKDAMDRLDIDYSPLIEKILKLTKSEE